MTLHPWARGPFELLVHAEGHRRNGGDFDRRIALISFDNAIEVAITTYLYLHPIQRGNRRYQKAEVEQWMANYHTKLDFFEQECQKRSEPPRHDKAYIIWAHTHRNEQYHGGNKGAPELQVLTLIRSAALWIFGVLFDVADPDATLETAMAGALPPPEPQPDDLFDRAIDNRYGLIELAGQIYYASELLFGVDLSAYREVGAQLCESPPDAGEEEA